VCASVRYGWLNSQQERLWPWPINRRFTSFLETAFTLPTRRPACRGQPQFNYYDAFQAKNFTGNQIQTADNVLGRLVTVFLIQTIDSGSTTFTLLVPTVNLPPSKVANITTEGITTLHKFAIVKPPQATDRALSRRWYFPGNGWAAA
jgi:hypothetical protein